jgi:hypothetical protein
MPESCEEASKALGIFKTNPFTEIDLLYRDLKYRTGTPGCQACLVFFFELVERVLVMSDK